MVVVVVLIGIEDKGPKEMKVLRVSPTFMSLPHLSYPKFVVACSWMDNETGQSQGIFT